MTAPGIGPILDPIGLAAEGRDLAGIMRRLEALERQPQLIPPTAHPGRPVQALSLDGYQNVTSGSLVVCWDTVLERVVHQAVFLIVPWATEAGTTGELLVTVGGASTSTVVLPAASSGSQTFRWRHGLAPWTNSEVYCALWARRTGGANNVRIGVPYTGFVQCDPRGATATGV